MKYDVVHLDILQNACDSSSSIMLALEMTESKEAMVGKKYNDQMSHGAAITLRLCEIMGIQGTRRTIYGDSFFSSLDTAIQLSANGLHFSGIVKTAHAGYPKMFLKDWYSHGFDVAKEEETARQLAAAALLANKIDRAMNAADRKAANAIIASSLKIRRQALNPRNKKKATRCAELPRGSHIALTAEFAHKTLLCCAWADKTNKTSIGTSGHTLPGTPIQRTTFKALQRTTGLPVQDVRRRSFPIPMVFETLFRNLPRIDVHDHLRQGTLALERTWMTQNWVKRVFSTILGMSITDAFLAFNLENNLAEDEGPAFPDFISRLAYQLIHNTFDEIDFQSPQASRRRATAAVSPVIAPPHQQHQLLNLALLVPFNKQINPRRKCSVKGCGRKTELYCKDCSVIDHASGHRLFHCCGVGQRVTVDRQRNKGGVRNANFGIAKVTQPFCYKWHLDHIGQPANMSSDGDEDSDVNDGLQTPP